jgi:signal transduction histidine kinase
VFRSDNGRFVELLDDNTRPLRNISCFKADTGEALWLGSRDEGLIYRTQAGRLARVPGLPVRAVNGILEDQAGVFWLASDRGVVRVNAQDLRLAAAGSLSHLGAQVLDLGDGLPGLETASGQPTSARDARGRLWFATSKGVAMIDPAEFRLNTRPPPVTVEHIVYHTPDARADGVEVRVELPASGPLRLPAGSRQIEVHYTALSFTAPTQIRFQVRLDGGDEVWRDQSNRRVVSFYDLSPGDYVFRVRAANNDGVWNDNGASLAFTVQPYLWQTTGFRVGLVLLLISTGGGIGWSIVRSKHRRELADLERTTRQQKELAHLSRVTMLGELSGSMAHELNQPLAAILSNAQAGLRFLARGDADLAEVREILQDIVDQDKRAGEVIRRLRALLKKGEVHRQPLDVNDIAHEVLTLVASDLVNHGVTTRTDLAPDLPKVNADRVQLEQVLLNLVMNASDAMNGKPAGDRRVIVRTERSVTAVCASGCPTAVPA